MAQNIGKQTLEVTGVIVWFGEVQSGTNSKQKEFKRQQIVIEFEDGKYTKKLCLTAWDNMVDKFHDKRLGELIEVTCNVESRMVKDRWVTDVRPWKLL